MGRLRRIFCSVFFVRCLAQGAVRCSVFCVLCSVFGVLCSVFFVPCYKNKVFLVFLVGAIMETGREFEEEIKIEEV